MKSIASKVPTPLPVELIRGSYFNESRLKLYRARQHACEFSAWWEEFIQHYANPAKRRELERQWNVTLSPYAPDAPIGIALPLGDCLRCLRSSLDYLVCALARRIQMPDNMLVFPFNEKCDGLKNSFRDGANPGKKQRREGALYKLGLEYPQLERMIIEDIQPYSAEYGARPSGDLLWRIITADNIDKHRLIVPTTSSSRVKHAKVRGGLTISNITFVGGDVFSTSGELEDDADVSVDILFKEPTRLAGKPITGTLIEGCQLVSNVIALFEQAFPSEPRK